LTQPAHRTGQADFPHPALGKDTHRIPPRHVTPSATSEHSIGVVRLIVNPQVLCCVLRPSLVGSRTGATPRRLGLSVAPRFLWECLTSRIVSRFPVPASSNPACRFPALGFPVCFLSRVMWLIRAERLSAGIAIHDPVIIKQSESVVDPSRTPPRPAESLAPSRT